MRHTRILITAIVVLAITFGLLRSRRQLTENEVLGQSLHETNDYSHAGKKPDTPNEPPQTTVTAEAPKSNEKGEGSLNSILSLFFSLPIRSYEESSTSNSQTCPTKGVNYDRNAVNGNVEKWRDMPSSQILEWRQGIVQYLLQKLSESQSESKPRDEEKKGRGIVMAAGDHDSAIRARTSLRLLKSYNCTLPVEIFHFSNELKGLDANLLEDFFQLERSSGGEEGMNITIRIVKGVETGNGWKQFQIKAASIQQSSFNEILYLDTDSYLLRNPSYVFESDEWKKTGLLLWPDYTKSHPSNPLWRLLGQECQDQFEGESGQMFVDRIRHQDLLWLVEYFAQKHEEFYGFMGGDRDSFRAAALLLGKRWKGPGRLNAAAGVKIVGDENGGGHTMLQADMNGDWLFVHANLIKHSRFWQRPLWSRIHRARDDKFQDGTTYGDMGGENGGNEKVGNGVKVVVDSDPRLVTSMSAFEGYEKESVVVEEWDTYEELRGFEEKWFGFGGVH